MILNIVLLLILISYVYRKNVINMCMSILLYSIGCYLYVYDLLVLLLPNYIYVGQYIYDECIIYKYICKHKNKYYTYLYVDNVIYDMADVFRVYNPDDMYTINYCGVIDKEGNVIRDVTTEVRYFMHGQNIIEWKYILCYLGITCSCIDYKLVVYMNDDDMTEKYFDVSEIYNEKFHF